jgi:sec-independent protein translocase protein TatB
VFGINGGEFILLAIIAVMVLGPERLPQYAAQLGRLVRELRRMATGAREQLREEVGPEFDDVDWRKLDPRQYDPRRIIKEALLEDLEDANPFAKPGTGPRPDTGKKPAVGGGQTAAAAAGMAAISPSPAATGAAGAAPAGSAPAGAPPRQFERLAAGEAAPFDREAT